LTDHGCTAYTKKIQGGFFLLLAQKTSDLTFVIVRCGFKSACLVSKPQQNSWKLNPWKFYSITGTDDLFLTNSKEGTTDKQSQCS